MALRSGLWPAQSRTFDFSFLKKEKSMMWALCHCWNMRFCFNLSFSTDWTHSVNHIEFKRKCMCSLGLDGGTWFTVVTLKRNSWKEKRWFSCLDKSPWPSGREGAQNHNATPPFFVSNIPMSPDLCRILEMVTCKEWAEPGRNSCRSFSATVGFLVLVSPHPLTTFSGLSWSL